MTPDVKFSRVIGVALVLGFLVACASSEIAPTSVSPTSTTVLITSIPPTPTSVPPTHVSPTLTTAPTTPVSPIPTPPLPTIEHIQITSRALAGNLLGDPAVRQVYVVLPPGYATSNKRYPVVFVLPWGSGGILDIRDNSNRFYYAMSQLLRTGDVKEMILVVPDGTNKLGASQWRNSATIGDYGSYVAKDVVDWIDTHYRTMATRDSRGLTGCSSGGTGTLRVGLKYPDVFSVLAATSGDYNDDPKYWPPDEQWLQQVHELPKEPTDLGLYGIGYYLQAAAGTVPDPNHPPFYFEMPIRIVNGRGELVPEVVAKINNDDIAHAAQRYVQQSIRLRGILIRHGLNDDTMPTPMVRDFDKLLTELGIEHQYVEVDTEHCGGDWVGDSLKFMSSKLVFEQQ